MTDNEIVKGLECHSRESNSCGSNCPYLMCEEVMCTKKLSKDALDLINRLQAENEKLQTVKKHIDTLIHRGVDYPTAEAYERAFYKALEQLYDNANAEEKLQQILPMLDELKGDIKHDINLAKAYAYKECIEKVKENSKKTEIVCSGALITTNYAISAKSLNKLLKELVDDDE